MKSLLFYLLLMSVSVMAQTPCGFRDGLQEGECKHFYDNGQIKEIANWKKGKLEGKAIYYYENGKKKAEGKHKKGFKVGVWNYYYENGNLSGKESWVYRDYMGFKEGEFSYYYENGILKEKYYLKDGKMNGEFLAYDEKGRLLNKAMFKNDVAQLFKIFYEDGEYGEGAATVNSKNKLIAVGEWKVYNKSGKMIEIITYKNGEKVSSKKIK